MSFVRGRLHIEDDHYRCDFCPRRTWGPAVRSSTPHGWRRFQDGRYACEVCLDHAVEWALRMAPLRIE